MNGIYTDAGGDQLAGQFGLTAYLYAATVPGAVSFNSADTLADLTTVNAQLRRPIAMTGVSTPPVGLGIIDADDVEWIGGTSSLQTIIAVIIVALGDGILIADRPLLYLDTFTTNCGSYTLPMAYDPADVVKVTWSASGLVDLGTQVIPEQFMCTANKLPVVPAIELTQFAPGASFNQVIP